MIIISHRVNTINKLLNISEEYGIEIDLRTRNEEIIISHDPFKNGEYFEDWIRHYKHKILIIAIITVFILSASGMTIFNNYKSKEADKVSNYYIKILSIIESDPERAKSELKKLAKLKNNLKEVG